MYISCRSPMYSTQRMCCIVLRGRRYQTKADRTMLLPVALQSGKGGYKVTKNFSPDNDLVSQHLPSAKDPEQRACFYRTQGCIILLDILSIALCRKRGILKGLTSTVVYIKLLYVVVTLTQKLSLVWSYSFQH